VDQQARSWSSARRRCDRARQLSFLFPHRDVHLRQCRPVIHRLAVEPLAEPCRRGIRHSRSPPIHDSPVEEERIRTAGPRKTGCFSEHLLPPLRAGPRWTFPALPLPRGTGSSNLSSSSRESGEIVGSATLAGRGRCFTAPRLFIWGLSISRAPLQAWAGNVLATSLSESGLGDDMAR